MPGLGLGLGLSMVSGGSAGATLASITASNGTSGADGTVSISVAGLQTGDVVVFAYNTGNLNTDRNYAASGNNSGALTEVADLYANATNDTNLYVGIAVQGATPDTSIAVTGMTLAATPFAYAISVWRDINATVQDVAATTSSSTTSDLANPAAITPTTAGAKIVAVYAAAQGTPTAWVAPANMEDFAQDAGGEARIGMAWASWTSGAFDPDAVTGGSLSAVDSSAAVTLALRPA